jgi:hypothetical protein
MTHRCPICHDSQPFVLWIDPEPPKECPYGADQITNCSYQMDKARGEAERRKICPEAFDQEGKIRPGGWGLIAKAYENLRTKGKKL